MIRHICNLLLILVIILASYLLGAYMQFAYDHAAQPTPQTMIVTPKEAE